MRSLLRSAAVTAIENRLQHARTHCPEPARPVQPIANRLSLQAQQRPEHNLPSGRTHALFDPPPCSFASATRRSLAAISGRRSSSCDGTPTGIAGGSSVSGRGARLRAAGLCPVNTAMACSNCARRTAMSASCVLVASSCVFAWATSACTRNSAFKPFSVQGRAPSDTHKHGIVEQLLFSASALRNRNNQPVRRGSSGAAFPGRPR